MRPWSQAASGVASGARPGLAYTGAKHLPRRRPDGVRRAGHAYSAVMAEARLAPILVPWIPESAGSSEWPQPRQTAGYGRRLAVPAWACVPGQPPAWRLPGSTPCRSRRTCRTPSAVVLGAVRTGGARRLRVPSSCPAPSCGAGGPEPYAPAFPCPVGTGSFDGGPNGFSQ